MPHLRKRHILATFLKKVDFSPVVIVNGARQCGKSFLIKDLYVSHKPNSRTYVTLDTLTMRQLAEQNPSSFLDLKTKSGILCIDEAQRVPHLFEAVKERVDKRRQPGQYILLGSTEFSHRTHIRESLTGRASSVQVFPFTIAEILNLAPSHTSLELPVHEKPRAERREVINFLNRGGLPGIFSVRDEQEREALWNDWVRLTCERDIYQIKGFEPDPSFAARVIQYISTHSDATISSIAKNTRTSLLKTKNHVEALRALFAITEVSSFNGPKSIFTCFDAGLTNLFASSFDVRLRAWVTHELFAKRSLNPLLFPKIERYLGAKGALIDFVIVGRSGLPVAAFKIFPFEKIEPNDFAVLRSFSLKYPRCKVFGLGTERIPAAVFGFEVFPWEAIV